MATLEERIVGDRAVSESITEQDMADLLAIYEAQEALQEVVESLIGEMIGCGPGEGICGDLGRVYDIIRRHSALPVNEDPSAGFEESPLGRILCDRKMSTDRKARIILGLEQ